MRLVAIIFALVALAGSAVAQGRPAQEEAKRRVDQQTRWQQWYGERRLLVELLGEGYEIKALSRLTNAEILYLQKGGSAYRCLAHDVDPISSQLPTNILNCAPLQMPTKQ